MTAKGISIKTLRNILFYIIGVFLFQELVFRFLFPVPEISNFDRINYMFLSYDNIGFKHSSNKQRLWQSQPDTSAIFKHHMNRYAFRDKEWEVDKPKGQKRALFIGDSFVEGIMASQNQTIPKSFEQASQNSYEVFNGGMVGCGLPAYLQLAADAIPTFKPDVTFLCIFANDLGKSQPRVPEYFLEPNYFKWYTPRLVEIFNEFKTHGPILFRWHQEKEYYLKPVPEKYNPWSFAKDTLITEVTTELGEQMQKASFNPFLVNALYKEEKYLRKKPKLGHTLPFFKYTCDKFHSKPIVVYIPSRNQLSDYYLQFEKQYCLNACYSIKSLTGMRYSLHQKSIAEQCKKLGISFIDLTSVLKEQESLGNHLYWNYDQHMKERGYTFVGEYIYKVFISKSNL